MMEADPPANAPLDAAPGDLGPSPTTLAGSPVDEGVKRGEPPQATQSMTEESLGRALAIAALEPIARRETDQREREEREEREEEERERREEEKTRKAEARAQLGKTLAREWWFIVIWNFIWVIALMGAALAITFAAPQADLVAAAKASWHYQLKSLIVAAVLVLIASSAYNLFRFRSGKPALAAGSFFGDFLLLGVAIPGVFVYSAARSGSVPPSAWSGAPLAVAAAFLIAVFIRLLIDRISNRDIVKLAVLLVCAGALAMAWFLAPKSDVPSRASQRKTDHRLQAAVPMSHCSLRPIAALPPSLFRNSLDGLLRCHGGSIRAKFMAFRNRELLDVYASQKEHAADRRNEEDAARCYSGSGSYTSTWFKEVHRNHELGPFICYGSGSSAVIQWADWRSNVFVSITGRSRGHLYHWWHQHAVSPRFRALRN